MQNLNKIIQMNLYLQKKRRGEKKKTHSKIYMHHMLMAAAKLLQSCLTLCDPTDSSPPGFAIPGILQARTLEWVVISFSNAWK